MHSSSVMEGIVSHMCNKCLTTHAHAHTHTFHIKKAAYIFLVLFLPHISFLFFSLGSQTLLRDKSHDLICGSCYVIQPDINNKFSAFCKWCLKPKNIYIYKAAMYNVNTAWFLVPTLRLWRELCLSLFRKNTAERVFAKERDFELACSVEHRKTMLISHLSVFSFMDWQLHTKNITLKQALLFTLLISIISVVYYYKQQWHFVLVLKRKPGSSIRTYNSKK